MVKADATPAAAAAEQNQLLTKSFAFTCSWMIRWVPVHLLLLLLISAQSVNSGQIVKYLPGYDGELPFKLETGYISVDDSELFYYFVESQGNPKEDPLFLWLSGGPGVSSMSGFLLQNGPLEFDVENYTGGVLKLKYYPYAQTKTTSMIFLDAPVGTGFSYSRTSEGWHSSDTKSSQQSYQFLKKWLIQHPEFLSHQLYIGGDSYSGILVPLITKRILDENKAKAKAKAEPYMNIKGYLVGCPRTDWFVDLNSFVPYAHGMALISDDIYENAKRSCRENYVDVDPANTACLAALGDLHKCIKDLNDRHILTPKCDTSYSPSNRRSLEQGASQFLHQPSMVPNPWCTTFKIIHGDIWGNDDTVQEALHVRKGTVQHWMRYNENLPYDKDVFSVVPVHKELSKSALEVLVESGDHDLIIPYVGTLDCIKSLNLTLVETWRPWFVDDQVAGYTMKYSEDGYRLTFATVKGAGHPAPEYKRKECYHLFDRWVRNHPI